MCRGHTQVVMCQQGGSYIICCVMEGFVVFFRFEICVLVRKGAKGGGREGCGGLFLYAVHGDLFACGTMVIDLCRNNSNKASVCNKYAV